MVLPEATASSEPSPFSSDASQEQQPPPNDSDPYAGDYNPTLLPSRDSSYFDVAPGVYINYDNLPQPWFSSRGMLKQKSMEGMKRMCRDYGEILGRPVRQDEAEAITYTCAHALRLSYFGAPIGVALGCLLAYRGNMKKPFSFPGPKFSARNFDYNKFGPLNGDSARRMWRVTRYIGWTSVAGVGGSMFGSIYGGTVAAVRLSTDPRLKELNEKRSEMSKQRRLNNQTQGGLPGGRKVDETPGQRDGETFDMARQRRNMQRMQQEARAKRDSTIDDTSPTGGSYGDEFLETSNNSGDGLMSDAQLPATQQSGRQAEAAQRATSRRSGNDNASSTTRSDTTSQRGGSAWDRLREQAASGQGQASSNTQRTPNGADGSSSLDIFAFSNADEEKQLAKSEAQKDFDARIERERAGKDFDERNGRGGWKS